MNSELIKSVKFSEIDTPAYVYDEKGIIDNIRMIRDILKSTGCRLYYPLKTKSLAAMLRAIKDDVDGFSASSLFEAKLAKSIHDNVHITSPGLRRDEIEDVAGFCHAISFNTISQYNGMADLVPEETSCGLRINTQLSFVKDDRYDPCRKSSRLGTPIDDFLLGKAVVPEKMEGLHFHTNSDSNDFNHLNATVRKLDRELPEILKQMKWINLGGGYVFRGVYNVAPLIEAIRLLEDKYGLQVIFEPGMGSVGNYGYIVSSVLDLIDAENDKIAVLDTSVNHMQEVFEYQTTPKVYGENNGAAHEYTFGGSTCLAGDLMGKHAFDSELKVGDKVVFIDMGAYTLVKTNLFNGVNYPAIYKYVDGEFIVVKKYGYAHFRDKWD